MLRKWLPFYILFPVGICLLVRAIISKASKYIIIYSDHYDRLTKDFIEQ